MMVRRLVGRLRAAVDSGRSTGTESASEASARGQSELVGTVLILGLSMAVIGTSVALGGVALGDLVSTAEADNVENGMSHLSSQVSLVALGDADSQRFSLGLMREGTVSVEPGAGSISIYNVTNGSRELLNENATSLGAVVYEGPNRDIAYQGGGIWTKYDNTSRLTSPPEYHYRGTTLTLPIINVTGEGTIGGQTSGRVTPVDVATNPVPGVSLPLDSGVIEVEIQSEYYKGWYEFLSQRTNGEIEIYHTNNTVVSKLTVPDQVTFVNAISVSSGAYANDKHQNSEVSTNSIEYSAATRSADPLIADNVEEANETNDNSDTECVSNDTFDGDEFNDECTITSSGTYFIKDDSSLDGNLNINTSDGNVTLVVDGNFDIGSNNITVTDTTTDNGVSYYINGSLQSGSNDGYVGTDNPEPESDRNVFYVEDQFLDTNKGKMPNFEAIIYAPDADLVSNGNGGVTGALVLNSFDIGPNIKIKHDSDLNEKVIDITGAADPITYLHVSSNKVRIELH